MNIEPTAQTTIAALVRENAALRAERDAAREAYAAMRQERNAQHVRIIRPVPSEGRLVPAMAAFDVAWTEKAKSPMEPANG